MRLFLALVDGEADVTGNDECCVWCLPATAHVRRWPNELLARRRESGAVIDPPTDMRSLVPGAGGGSGSASGPLMEDTRGMENMQISGDDTNYYSSTRQTCTFRWWQAKKGL